jgi:hypothetical protein
MGRRLGAPAFAHSVIVFLHLFRRSFYCMLAGIVVEDRIRALSKDETGERYDPELGPCIEAHPLAKEVFFFYVLDRVMRGDSAGAQQALALLMSLKLELGSEHAFLQSVTSAFMRPLVRSPFFCVLLTSLRCLNCVPRSCKQERAGDTARVVLNSLLVPLAARSSFAHLQVVRLLADSTHRLPASLVLEILPQLPLEAAGDEKIDIAERARRDVPHLPHTSAGLTPCHFLQRRLAMTYRALLARHPQKVTPKNSKAAFDLVEKHAPLPTATGPLSVKDAGPLRSSGLPDAQQQQLPSPTSARASSASPQSGE